MEFEQIKAKERMLDRQKKESFRYSLTYPESSLTTSSTTAPMQKSEKKTKIDSTTNSFPKRRKHRDRRRSLKNMDDSSDAGISKRKICRNCKHHDRHG
jgi:hypothetical protein